MVFLDLQLKVVLLAMFVRLEIKPVLFWIVSEECCCQASSVEVSDSMAPAAPAAAAGPSVNVQTQHRQYCHRFWLCIECKRSMCSVHSVDYVVERCLCVTCQHMLHFPGKHHLSFAMTFFSSTVGATKTLWIGELKIELNVKNLSVSNTV